MSISRLLVSCLDFEQLIKTADDNEKRLAASGNEVQLQGEIGSVPLALWQDELGRLRIWAANIGAHQTGNSSLDYRLRHASRIHGQVINLFYSLISFLSDAKTSLLEQMESTNPSERLFSNKDSDQENDPDLGEPIEDIDALSVESTTELEEIRSAVANTITCLYQMSILIRRPAQHNWKRSYTAEVKAFEPFDVNHVREKFPHANYELIQRLGKAITRRRGYLRDRERHRAKLGRDLDDEASDAVTMSETVATPFKDETPYVLKDSASVSMSFIGKPPDFYDNSASVSGVSQTSYAKSLQGEGATTVPSPPKGWEPDNPSSVHIATSLSHSRIEKPG